MSRQQEGRLVFLDAAKGVGILAVMFGHITKLGNPVDIWLSTFKLPVFFIVAGFLICHKGEIAAAPFGKFALKRVKSMLLPYFYFSAVVILYRFFLAVFKGKEMAQVLEVSSADLLDTLSLRGISALWFLPAIFIAEILFFLAMRFCAAGRLLCAAAAFAAYFGTDPLLGLIEGWDARCFEVINRPVIVLAKGMVGALFVACGYLLHGFMQRFSSRTGGAGGRMRAVCRGAAAFRDEPGDIGLQ